MGALLDVPSRRKQADKESSPPPVPAAPTPPTPTKKPQYTTLRFFQEDGEDISDLADMEGKTIAQLYRELCAPVIRQRRIALMEERLKRLKGTPPGSG